jgi:hypothetical protein
MLKFAAAAALAAALLAAAPARAEGLSADLSLVPGLARTGLSLQLTAAEPDKVSQPTTVFGLPKNMGPIDRGVRLALAATLVGWGAYRLSNDKGSDGASWAMIGVAAIPATTGATGYCPLYQLLGIDNTF